MLIHEQACSKTPSRCLTPLFVYSNPDDDCLHPFPCHARSEEHTSELQSQSNLVCRLLLEKKTTNEYSTVTLGRMRCATRATMSQITTKGALSIIHMPLRAAFTSTETPSWLTRTPHTMIAA